MNVTGRWTGTVDSTTGPPSFDANFGEYQLTLDLVQDGAGVTGTFQGSNSLSGTVSGGVSDRTAQLVMQFAPCGGPPYPPGAETFRGTVDASGTSMSVVFQGTPCGAPDETRGTLTLH